MKPLQNLIMPNLNSDSKTQCETGCIEYIPNSGNEKENRYFGLAMGAVIVVAFLLLTLTRQSSPSVSRPPQALLHIITQFQNAIDEVSLMAELNNMPLPLSLEQLRDLEIEPYLSEGVTSPELGCFVYENDLYQLRITYLSEQKWSIDWRLDEHDDHDNETTNKLCHDAEHWSPINAKN